MGSATGLIASEFGRRGGCVVSVEVSSLEVVDQFPSQEAIDASGQLAAVTARSSTFTVAEFEAIVDCCSPEDSYHYFLDGPSQLCHRALDPQIERHHGSVCDSRPPSWRPMASTWCSWATSCST